MAKVGLIGPRQGGPSRAGGPGIQESGQGGDPSLTADCTTATVRSPAMSTATRSSYLGRLHYQWQTELAHRPAADPDGTPWALGHP